MSALKIRQLRREIARLETQGSACEAGPAAGADGWGEGGAARVPLGLADLDAALGGGLARGALHEIRAEAADAAAAFGFALALGATLAPPSAPLLHVTLLHVAGEWGRPYGPGLVALGLDPGRLLLAMADRPAEALWICEEALGCAGLAAVILEIAGQPAALDLTAGRRLALRAARGGVAVLLVRPGAGEEASAAATRWRLAPAADPAVPPYALPRPVWRARLERNRAGRGGAWSLSWRPDVRALAPAAPLSVASPAAPADRAPPARRRG